MPSFREQAKKRESQRRCYFKARRKAMDLLGGKCVACGEDDYDVLQFDHIEPVFRRSNGLADGKPCKGHGHAHSHILRLDNPAEVYQVLCANCHAKKSASEKVRNETAA